MANNRMIIACNKCIPTDNWNFGADVCYVGKWYPVGDYRSTVSNEQLGEKINEYLMRHAHNEDLHNTDMIQNENPVRLTYETWVRDMPAIKKWENK